MGARFSALVQPAPGLSQSPRKCIPCLFRMGKVAGAPSKAEVKERVPLYQYSRSCTSWPVQRRNLPLPPPPKKKKNYLQRDTHTQNHKSGCILSDIFSRSYISQDSTDKYIYNVHAGPSGLLGLWVQIPLGAWMFVCCECCVLSGRGLCDELITRPEESYQLWYVAVCDL